MKTSVSPIEEWPLLLSHLPADLEASAKACGALQRKRGITSAQVLLRLAFAYAYTGWSLQATITWARGACIARLTAVALWKRLRRAAAWSAHLLAQTLAEHAAVRRDRLPPGSLPVRLIDASSLSTPGSKGTDYRVHLQFDLGTLTTVDVTLTDAHGGESLTRCRPAPGEIVMADRGYAHRAGIAAVVASGAVVLVRLGWQSVPLQRRDGTPFDLLAAAAPLAAGEIGEWEVQTAPDKTGTPAVPGRLVALHKSEQATEAARRKLRATARKKGRTPDARSLEAAAFVFVFTTAAAEQLPAPAVLEVYRFRWQIELAFKRLKGVLALDELAAKDPDLCRTVICLKLLGALLVERLSHHWVDFSPWGYGTPAAAVADAGLPAGGGDDPAGGGRGADAGAVGSRDRRVGGRLSRHPPEAAQPGRRGRLVRSSPSYR
jgi:Transposase DDE domain